MIRASARVLFEGEHETLILPACEHIAGNEKFIRKALALQSEHAGRFDVTLDLEDGAVHGREREQAQMAVDVLVSSTLSGRVGLRIHDPRHPSWRNDLETVLRGAASKLSYITVPKVRSAQELRMVAGVIEDVLRSTGSARRLPLHVLIETHGALRDVMQIAALPLVEVLDFGLMDFIAEHHGAIPESCMGSPGQFDHVLLRRAKAEICAAAHAYGKVPAHNVTVDLSDEARTFEDARRAHVEFGFLRMWSIHPMQIDAILRGMAPERPELEYAEELISAAADAEWGPIRHRDRLHDRASYRYYASLLKRASAAGAALSERSRQILGL